MTREEFIDRYEHGFYNEYEVINSIYDDFESRTCENCKWFDKWEQCSNEDSPCNHILFSIDKDFGCNKFERKTDGDV